MQDLTNGRINTNNLTAGEWDLVKRAYDASWFCPNEDDWLLMRNLLGLFEIQCGYSVEVDADHESYLQAGAVQIKLNNHGTAAWELLRDTGRYYESGKPSTFEDIEPYMTDYEIGLFKWRLMSKQIQQILGSN